MTRRLAVLAVIGVVIWSLYYLGVGQVHRATGPEQARKADDFVDYVGVATHFGWEDTVYAQDFDLASRKLRDLGVRHIRDGAYLGTEVTSPDGTIDKTATSREDLDAYGDVYDRYKALTRGSGIKATLTVDPGSGFPGGGLSPIDPITPYKIERIQTLAGPSLEAFEGPNEHNKSNEGPNAGQNPDWAAELETWQRQLWESVNVPIETDPGANVTDVPVLGPSIGKPYPDTAETPYLGDAMDYGSIHPYRIGHPGSNEFENYDVARTESVSGDGSLGRPKKPLMVTETGYYTAPNDTCQNTEVSEKAAGKYVPRMALEYFNYGGGRIARSYFYELIDHFPDTGGIDSPPDGATQANCGGYDWQRHFGLLRNDGSEKPSFRALENLIDVLEEPGAPNFRPGSLDFTLDNSATTARGDVPASVHHTLLQKSDGTFYLVLWNEASSYRIPPAEVSGPRTCEEVPNVKPCTTTINPERGSDVVNAPVQVTLRFDSPFAGVANEYLTNRSTAVQNDYEGKLNSIDLQVPDEPLVVELVPRSIVPTKRGEDCADDCGLAD